MMNNYVYIIIYDKVSVSSEGYDSLDKAIARLEEQGYKQYYGWLYQQDEYVAQIKEIKIV